jgi:hypothetical protein
VLQEVLQPIGRVEPLVQGEDLVESAPLRAVQVGPVLEEQVLAALERLPALGVGLAGLLVPDVVDDLVERLDHAEAVKGDVGLRAPVTASSPLLPSVSSSSC